MTSANQTDTNGFEQPEKVVPVVSKFDSVSSSFQNKFQPNSITILRMATRPPNAIGNMIFRKSDTETYMSAHMISGNRFSISLNLSKSSLISAKLVDCSGKTIVSLLQRQRFEKGVQHIGWQLPKGKMIRNGLFILVLSIDDRMTSTPFVMY